MNVLSTNDRRHVVHFEDSKGLPRHPDGAFALSVFSPPYGLGVQYGTDVAGQIEMPVLSMEDYDTFRTRLFEFFPDIARVIVPGGYVAINIPNPHTDSKLFGRNMVLPLAYDAIRYWVQGLGWDLKADIFWRAARTIRADNRETISILGSYPLPLEGCVGREIEHILVFRKPGLPDKKGRPTWGRAGVDPVKRKASKLTLDEWMAYFNQVWEFPGAAKESSGGVKHSAPYPLELPKRLVKMYSVVDDWVLDPFGGTGTTAQACQDTGRRSVSYEVNPEFYGLIESKLLPHQTRLTEET
jgi:DNA modification methylase